MAYYSTCINNISHKDRVVTMDETKKDTEDEVKIEPVSSVTDACVQHGREIMDAQLALIKEKGYDFAPQFKEMTIHLYLFGVIWKFAEGLDELKKAREHAFSAIQSMLVSDGMPENKMQKHIELLKKMTKLEDGSDAHAVEMGYLSKPDDDSLAELLDEYVNEYQVSGDFWRLFERGKKTMLYGGLLAFFIAVWTVTLFMPGNSALSILTAGIFSAAVFVVPTFLIGLIIFKLKMKKAKQQA